MTPHDLSEVGTERRDTVVSIRFDIVTQQE